MWVHYLYNKQYKIGFKTQFYHKCLAKNDFNSNLQNCINLGDTIKYISNSEFKTYRNNKLCVICKYYKTE